MTSDRYIYGLCEVNSTALGKLIKPVKISSASIIDYQTIRITFDRAMKKDNKLSNKSYYAVYPISSGGVYPYINSIELPDVNNPMYVDLIISEMTGNLAYEIAVSQYGPTDVNGINVDEYYNTKTFTAICINPSIKEIVAISETRLNVVFTENMKYNDAIKDPNKYTFNNGLLAVSVLEVSGDTVKLVTSEQYPNLLYTLTLDT